MSTETRDALRAALASLAKSVDEHARRCPSNDGMAGCDLQDDYDAVLAALRATDAPDCTFPSCSNDDDCPCATDAPEHPQAFEKDSIHNTPRPRATDVPVAEGLREAVIAAEWMDPTPEAGSGRCPACHVYRANGTGHSPYCWFAPIAALATPEPDA